MSAPNNGGTPVGQGNGAPLRAEVTSTVPGRLRLRIREPRQRAAHLRRIHTHLESHGAVANVESNPRTGSVLVHYHPRGLSHDDLFAMLRDIGVVVGAVSGEEEIEEPENGISTSGSKVVDAIDDLDRRIAQATGYRIDLKALFPLSLAALGTR